MCGWWLRNAKLTARWGFAQIKNTENRSLRAQGNAMRGVTKWSADGYFAWADSSSSCRLGSKVMLTPTLRWPIRLLLLIVIDSHKMNVIPKAPIALGSLSKLTGLRLNRTGCNVNIVARVKLKGSANFDTACNLVDIRYTIWWSGFLSSGTASGWN